VTLNVHISQEKIHPPEMPEALERRFSAHYEHPPTPSHAVRKYGRKQNPPLQRFALQARISGVFITLVWGIIPTSLFRNTEGADSG
jgi:hypothetical protein